TTRRASPVLRRAREARRLQAHRGAQRVSRLRRLRSGEAKPTRRAQVHGPDKQKLRIVSSPPRPGPLLWTNWARVRSKCRPAANNEPSRIKASKVRKTKRRDLPFKLRRK